MHIVLLEPEIPQNAGNIARTCAVTNSVLHLIKPLGFSVEDKYLKRAGLDYWKLLDIRYYENFGDFCEKNPNAKIWMASTKARHVYADVTYGENDYIMFGKESAGIPEEILMAHEANTIRIPMLEAARSLNLSNSVAIIIYEAMRQQGFPGISSAGGAGGSVAGNATNALNKSPSISREKVPFCKPTRDCAIFSPKPLPSV